MGGIINNGGTVIVDGSQIDDALTALQSNGGSFKLRNSIFDSNRQPVNAHTGNFTDSIIAGCLFTYGNLPVFDIGLPESNVRITNATNLRIGYGPLGPLVAANTFTKAVIGIYARNSDMLVCNSTFVVLGHDYTDENGNTFHEGWGINANSTA